MVYKNNVLQYILNEEGRSRPEVVTDGPQSGATKFVYDYFIKDHLGNVRTTLAAEPASHDYYARHEMATANSEQLIFDNIATVRDDKPGSINMDDRKAARLNAAETDRSIGTAIMLRVMPGDKFTFAADAYYEENQDEKEYQYTGAEEIVSSLLATLTGGTVGGKPVSETQNGKIINDIFSKPETMTGIQQLLDNVTTPNTAPRAGLNFLFFDEQMNLLSGSGRLVLDHTPTVFTNLAATVETEAPGYVIVYVDNQTIGKDVWFDDVQVLHYNTRVLEENHYYPFGLTIATEAMGVTAQPLKYNGKELETSFDLQTYEYGARQYNSQIGRWNGIDPLADKYFNISPFAYVANDPINAIDPDGRLIIFINGNHFGDGADKYYAYNKKAGNYRFTGTWDYWRSGSDNFDLRVMMQLNDSKAIYRDGAMGGFFGLSSDNPISINSPYGRDKNGYIQGQKDAATIVRLLDKGETIKVITHSMGGAYGKGYVRALKDYIATLPNEQQSNVLISLVADFDPHQAKSFSADENIYTQQFSHKSGKGRKSSDNMGWLANQTEKGVDYYNEDNKDSSHSIFTFMKNISELKEGTYKWDGKGWICQTCK